ncbi:bifunctional 2-C-methyl-D-erythritol 4-phosphate cytidylyltransferase/2-C-methyl-D-erythritol 2,4-cyclodiphosphate synthase [Pseudovibrio exalbescens]|uniref:bifunctional 2-C-methyl-D-erythritol 4-phosphate cytidylyltransferase/2-C-methyl-D-erythritol 2,4-cyclodiphosphate synthase n=1 Tax=Pseudovibrio exalbescens TaxID=197461 RepID=UPI0023671277|nr:bifunctional 2-C-methyl-D-erythritol 4-phosphate cytidylyltransferase/2-C-methyl-D-erythritol 2,4-cyclodiphosphate synthase [Pseudovibrio exalbescens]MDD7908713.1 bifunctional 2-C-methyl-D-erythritol 4-phosphate cytidylyltransferase/2-C-methyl-D-erythritol 2,4-cyclodiphosphate synthase [Pseudovibrio exalbescens]
MTQEPQIVALVVAAGRGSRMLTDTDSSPKQYRDLAGQSVLQRTCQKFIDNEHVSRVLCVIHADDFDLYEKATLSLESHKLLPPVVGGRERQESVRLGLAALAELSPDFVLIHDGVRPFITQDVINRVVNQLKNGSKAVLPSTKVSDTLKSRGDDGTIAGTIDRTRIWSAQTPQGFDFDAISGAHRQVNAENRNDFTDDTALMEHVGIPVLIVEGDSANVKLTTPRDMELARQKVAMENTLMLSDIRVGSGYDVHAFEKGDAVILGGISIPHTMKLKGHSDADVALHAITDAIFGALADGDIGSHFPPSDPQWKGAASDQFLKYAVDKVTERGGRIAHLDCTIICESPKIGPYRDAMRARISEICELPIERVAVKATTSEKLGFTGREEGIASMATATIRLPGNEDW